MLRSHADGHGDPHINGHGDTDAYADPDGYNLTHTHLDADDTGGLANTNLYPDQDVGDSGNTDLHADHDARHAAAHHRT